MQFLLEEVMFQSKACVLGKKVVLTTMTIIGVFPTKCLHSFFFFCKEFFYQELPFFSCFHYSPNISQLYTFGFSIVGLFSALHAFLLPLFPRAQFSRALKLDLSTFLSLYLLIFLLNDTHMPKSVDD